MKSSEACEGRRRLRGTGAGGAGGGGGERRIDELTEGGSKEAGNEEGRHVKERRGYGRREKDGAIKEGNVIAK